MVRVFRSYPRDWEGSAGDESVEVRTSTGRRKYDGLLPMEMRRLKQLEDENGQLRKVVEDLSLDKAMLQDVIRRKF
jgi:hypothetical protein